MLPASVSLHPVASRRGEQSATLVSVHLNHESQGHHNHSIPQDVPLLPQVAQQSNSQSDAFSKRPSLRRAPHSSGPTEWADDRHTATPSHDGQHDTGDHAAIRTATVSPTWGLQHEDLSIYPVIDLPRHSTTASWDATPRADSAASSPAPSSSSAAAAAAAAAHRKRSVSIASAPMITEADPPSWAPTGADPPAPNHSVPLRRLNVHQFVNIFSQYASSDVPHAVVFPFLHGVDGDNVAQNVFFGAPLSGMPAPRYRGLTVIRADMPAPGQRVFHHRRDRQRAQSHRASSATSRTRADSCVTEESYPSHNNNSANSSTDGHDGQFHVHTAPVPLSTASSSHSVSSQSNSLFSHRGGVGSASLSSMTSLGSSIANEDGFFPEMAKGHQSRHSSSSFSAIASYSHPYEPQPSHSLLNSSIFPVEVLVAPASAAGKSAKRDCNATLATPPANSRLPSHQKARFLKPKQAPGVSLRNFKIQSARYATISDVVIYCPSGLHEGMIELAQWFRDAQQTCWEERQAKNLGGLRYNVFLVEDGFDVFEEYYPDLVAVDSSGRSAKRVDFIEREREEMQRLTKATEIDTNVWLGSTGDVPLTEETSERMELPSTFSHVEQVRAANPHAFAICVEAHEAGEMPTPSRLAHAASYLDAIEDAIRSASDSRDLGGADKRSREEGSSGADRGRPSLSLGPKGWSPPLRKRSAKGWTRSGSRSPSDQSNFDQTPVNLPAAPVLVPPDSMVLLESAVAGQRHLESLAAQEMLADRMIDFSIWIKQQADPSSVPAVPTSRQQRKASAKASPRAPRRILLHCGDGYTETSMIALTYLMYARALTLPEAYLYLQNEAERSFFVYGRDLPLLKKIEIKVRNRLALQQTSAHGSTGWDRSKSHSWSSVQPPFDRTDSAHFAVADLDETIASDEETDPSFTPERGGWQKSLVAAASGLVSAIPSHHRRNASTGSSVVRASGGMTRVRTPTPSSPECETPSASSPSQNAHAWFYDAHFEGAFPSRILPFLYLGNLHHALNAAMLHALGITHVVSVGESALATPDGEVINIVTTPAGKASSAPVTYTNSLWHEQQAGRISVLDMQNVSDDGIDPLRSTMKEAVEYIEGCRRQGGKVLVHCRVGVSRSSTIVLAYVMAHLDLSLVESYLLVRSRRLNILIQPHLLFFWELRGWETYLARQKLVRAANVNTEADGDFVMSDVNDTQDGRWTRGEASLASLTLASTKHSPVLGHNAFTEDPIDVDLAVGKVLSQQALEAISHGLQPPAALPPISMRLTWGFLAREIARLNERYFV